MSSLFRSLNNFNAKRENAIKEALINTLHENSREIEYEAKQTGRNELELCEVTSALCTTLEAIFLHGLKDSFLWQTLNVISGDVERRPEPSFWSPVMVFMHKQDIEQIHDQMQITTEVGQCRAWIRLTLNEALFSAYLRNIRKNSSALSPYYKKFALLKDADGLETAVKIMEGLETNVIFNLPVNSSLLNHWPDYALQLSGLWTPALKSCPISSGVDIAGSLASETAVAIPTPQPVRTDELFSESISNSPFRRGAHFPVEDLDQGENLDLFLQKVDEVSEEDIDIGEAQEAATEVTSEMTETEQLIRKKSKRNQKSKKHGENDGHLDDGRRRGQTSADAIADEGCGEETNLAAHGHGNSLNNLMHGSWSGDINGDSLATPATSEDGGGTRFLQRSVSMTSAGSSTLRSPLSDRCSYNALLRKHERNRDVDWTEVWEKFLLQNSANLLSGGGRDADSMAGDLDAAEGSSNDSRANSDFEMISGAALEKFDIAELQEMVEQLCHLAREPGLDAQGFLCRSCQHPLGIGYSSFRVCAFSGNYFCDKCMDLEPVMIPSKIIYNWDFRKYSVSKRSAAFLAEFRNQPFIDLQLLNPDIYMAFEAMAELQALRIRLNFIRAYLCTCSPTRIEELRMHFFGKEYLYEHIHQYSIGDLGMIPRGTLFTQLHKAFKIGEAHILKCGLCSVKGFICEVCQSSRLLYPFHIDTTYRCETCGAVFHPQCLNEREPCPKCERKRRRELEPLMEAVEGLTSD